MKGIPRPVAGVELPVTGVQLPVTGIELPVTGIQMPVTGVQMRITGIQMPVTGNQLPVIGNQLPVIGIQLPVIGIQLPVIGIQLPVIGIQMRITGIQMPATGVQLPLTVLENHLSGKLIEVRRERMPYDVFLSHAGADKPAVERLATKLREAGVEPFLDKWHLIPGQPWQEALGEALDQSRTCAVFIGKELGPWQDKEMRSALETQAQNRSFRVIPVLLPGGRRTGEEKLPRFLRGLTWVDFRAGLDDEEAFRHLLAGIRGEAPGPVGGGETQPPPYRCMAPPREPFVARREYEEAVQALLTGGDKERAATVGLTTALQGAGGFGKTALATELCYAPRVREQYPDGVLWVQMRDTLDDDGRLKEIRDVLRRWTREEPSAFETVAKAGQHLIELLEGKRVLLVVDDVWRLEDITPSWVSAPRLSSSSPLVTARRCRWTRCRSM